MRKVIALMLILTSSVGLVAIGDDSFRGTILFDLTYTAVDERLSVDDLCEFQGSKMAYHIGEEGYVERYYCEDRHVQVRWYEATHGTLYYKSDARGDTVYYYSSTASDYDAEFVLTGDSEEICGYACDKITATLTPKEPGADLGEMRYDYFVAKGLPVHPETFRNFQEGGFDQLMDKMPGVILKQVYYGEYYTMTRVATNVVRGEGNPLDRAPQEPFIKQKI